MTTLQCEAHAGFRFRHHRRRHRRGFRRLPPCARRRAWSSSSASTSPAYHTTGRSAALHSETYGSAEIRAITVASGRFYRKPPAGFTDHPLLTPRGALIAGRAEQQAAMQKAAAEFARLVPSVRWLDPAEALRRQPLLKPEAAAGGAIFEPEADDMDVAAIHGGFLKGARAAGAVLRLDAEVTDLDRKDGRWTIRPARRRERRRRQHRQRLGRLGRRRWAAWPAPRRSGWCRSGAPPSPSMRRPGLDLAHLPMVIDFDESWYIKPEVGQFLGSPADETPSPPCDAQPEEIDIAIAVERIETATTLSIRRIKNKWAGLRSFVADKNLVVGYDPKVEGFFWLAGQGGYGIQTGEAAGRLAASLALGKGLPADIAALGVSEAALSPARFTRVT